MHIPQLIERKRDGGRLAAAEISALIDGFTNGSVPDYQMTAFAMAVFFSGMDDEETAALTLAMRDSGQVFAWPKDSPPKVDKHSTGGVGDKVSLILAPLLACDDLWVPMVSGRGLGITGGTLDKLESIPGFRVHLSERECLRQLEEIGVFLAGQTEGLCPADKRLYALRDVTGTVPSRPLIIASIMAKKLAEALDRLVLDVKFGRGAFMKTRADAGVLADGLQKAGNANGVATTYVLSPMDEPLGRTAGNALEVLEAVATLRGQGPPDLVKLTLDLAERVAASPRRKLERILSSGAAWEKFVRLVEVQGGNCAALEKPGQFHPAPVIEPLPSAADGLLRKFDAGIAGGVVVRLGGGRAKADDPVDFAVGLSGICKVGEPVVKGQPLCLIHARDNKSCRLAADLLRQAIKVQ